MHIGILYYKEPQRLMGRHVANRSFIEALFKYKGEHKVTVLNPDEINIPEFLSKEPLDVLHYPGPDLYRALSLKTYNPKPMAVTGITHTLGHAPYLEWFCMNLIFGTTESDALICTSYAAQAAIKKISNNSIEGLRLYRLMENTINLPIIPLGVDSSSYFKAPKEDDVIRLLYLGRFCKYTKVDLFPLLEMVKEVMSKTDKKVELILAGADSANYAKEVHAKSCELSLEMQIVTNISGEYKRDLLSKCDIFLAPSNNTQETFGLSLLEAMASGLPIVAYDWSGYRDIVQEGVTGFLIPTTLKPKGEILPFQYDAFNQKQFSNCVEVDKEEFIKKTLWLIESKEVRENMAIQSLLQIKHFDWAVIIPKYIKLWQDLSSKATPSTSNLKTLDYFKVFSHYATKVALNG